MFRQSSYFSKIWIALCIGTCIIYGCVPTQTQNTKDLDGPAAVEFVKRMGTDLEASTASHEEEAFVLNHFQNLWHYMQVSTRTTVTYQRIYYSGWGKETETVHADIELQDLGLVQITAVDNDGSTSPGIDEGTIRFSLEVETPEKGTATGEFYPFGSSYQDVAVPPSYNMKMPGGYFVPAGGLLDFTRRHMESQDLIPVLQRLVTDVYLYGMDEVPRTN